MDAVTPAEDTRRKTNPVFNDRKLKLGTFGTNLDRGCAISTIDGVLEINWPNTLELAKTSEAMEFEALVPIGRWHGFGGVTNFNGPGFECFSWAAAIGASTRYSGIFATSHVPTIHPVMAAKQAATIDHVTGGRFALNIVTGWNRPEIEMFGSPLMEHNDRYDCAAEWLHIMKELWTRDEPFDFTGRFYTIKKGYLEPKPIQRRAPFTRLPTTSTAMQRKSAVQTSAGASARSLRKSVRAATTSRTRPMITVISATSAKSKMRLTVRLSRLRKNTT